MGYVFDDVDRAAELERLRAIERIFDPATQRLLSSTGLRQNWTCLEVGPGAGSILAWLAETAGHVTAVDLDPRFLRDLLPNVELRTGDIRSVALPSGAFDLIHARFVLIHVPDAATVVERLLGLLKPGGWIALEEPDFTAARPLEGREATAFRAVHRAIDRMYAAKSVDAAFGARLPALLDGLSERRIERDETPAEGGGALALMMGASARQLREKYAATGEATAREVEDYLRFTADPASRAVYYATVRAVGRRP